MFRRTDLQERPIMDMQPGPPRFRRARVGFPHAMAIGAAAVLSFPLPLHGQSDDPGLDRLEREIARLSEAAEGVVGIAALHLESGRRVVTHAGERFPMASTYKVPIAVQLLTRVDRGEIRLDSMVTLTAGDRHPGSGTLASDLFNDPGVALSVRNLLELMLLISDNSATDVCLELAGGAAAVNQRMAELGVSGVQVNRPTSRLIADWLGVQGVPDHGDITMEEFRGLQEATDSVTRAAGQRAFATDPQDTSTPEGMADLLEKAWRGEAMSAESTELFWDVMRRVQTGTGRLKGRLPAGTTVAHKTGTIGRTTNDVGVITLPDDGGHVVVVAFVKDSDVPIPDRERVIAEVARAVHDYFLFVR
ncbi:MAG: class A beta-lactamase [Longimicrobiales bacterium]